MKNILEDFANDHLQPDSRYFTPNSEYARAIEQLADAENTLRTAIGEPERKLLDDYIKAQDEVIYLTKTDRFIYGYRLGVMMTMEVCHTSDQFVVGGEEK